MRRQYPFHLIEPKWQQLWESQATFRAWNPGDDIPASHPFAQRHNLRGPVSPDQLPPKFYILDMFPYPSGAGLHVGHPEGYTATDILARYHRALGRNVLHPMGWDAFGLPAEQYAIRTGQHPRKTTEENIAVFKRQIQSLGFSYDWSRELDTTDPHYFKWTQWIFLKLYNSWFNPDTKKAESIEILDDVMSEKPNRSWVEGQYGAYLSGLHNQFVAIPAENRAEFKQKKIDEHRLAYVANAEFWWCEDLGTVLSNEEVVDGKSEVGGFPVRKRPMLQWVLRITAYAKRLFDGLDTIDWSNSLKEMQRNWIGRSEGAIVKFQAEIPCPYTSKLEFEVFTTRPDTLFGVTYIVVAPEHQLINWVWSAANHKYRINEEIKSATVQIVEGENASIENLSLAEALAIAKSLGLDLLEVNPNSNPPTCMFGDYRKHIAFQESVSKQLQAVQDYREQVARKSDLDRTDLAKEKTGVFTGAYALNPVNGERIPIWIADYVLSNYGTGAIMAVPGHDDRDFEFARRFALPIVPVVRPEDGDIFMLDLPGDPPDLKSDEKIQRLVKHPELFYKTFLPFDPNAIAINSTNSEFSLNELPTPEAKKKITAWLEEKGLGRKTVNYKLRDWLFSRQRYWGEPFPIVWKPSPAGVFRHEALPESSLPLQPPELSDFKPTSTGEPPLARAKQWVVLPDGSKRETNTMPQWAGSCWYYLRFTDAHNALRFCGSEAEAYWMGTHPSGHGARSGVDLYVGGVEHAVLHLLYARFWHQVLFDLGYVSTPEPFFKLVNQGLILGEDGQKMSKSRGNVVNPDDVMREFGADALRLFEMFMGPLEMVKPWSTKGVEGVYRFLGRVWRLFVDEKSETEFEQTQTAQAANNPDALAAIKLSASIKDTPATAAQLKTLHACIKKVTEDLDGFRFNTAISALMIFVNDAITWETKPASVMRDFLLLLQPFAPHLAEELGAKLCGGSTLAYQPWPKFNPLLLAEDTIEIAIQVNGKLRDKIVVPAAATSAEIEAAALASEKVQQALDGKPVKKVIVVPKRLVNIVV